MDIIPHYRALIGSRLYGTHKSTSDYDYRGWCIPPKEYLFGLQNFEQKEYSDRDEVIYSLKKFLDLLVKGNTQGIESLFAKQYDADYYGNKIRDNRHLFLSSRYYNSIKGFAFAEWRKSRSVTIDIKSKDVSKKEILDLFCAKFHLKRYQRNEILSLLEYFTDSGVEIVETVKKEESSKMGNNGYKPKNAYHTIRLLNQGIELLTDETITYPRPEKNLLIAIRNDEISLNDLEKIYEETLYRFERAKEITKLPSSPPMGMIHELYMEIIEDFI